MAAVSMKELLEAGVHFGHRTRRWNPKMRPYIFTERSGIHIIDLQQTMQLLNEYSSMIRDIVARGGTILFVGTKSQARDTVKQEADRCGMPYINQRWLGGTLINWVSVRQRVDYLLQIERRFDAGEFRTLSKKEQLGIQREIEKLNHRIGGLKTMRRLPDLIFIVDINTEDLAVMEANKLRIPTIAMVDTNSNPDLVDYVIPSNDDAILAVKLIVSVIADAVEEGTRIREVDKTGLGQINVADLSEYEHHFGFNTLAKLKVRMEDFEDFEEDNEDFVTFNKDEGYEEYIKNEEEKPEAYVYGSRVDKEDQDIHATQAFNILNTQTHFQNDVVEAYAVANLSNLHNKDSVMLGQTVVLRTGVLQDITNGLNGVSLAIPTHSNQQISFMLEISVYAEAMEIKPNRSQIFIFDRRHDVDLLEFELTPHRLGLNIIEVEFYYERHWLAQIQLKLKVMSNFSRISE